MQFILTKRPRKVYNQYTLQYSVQVRKQPFPLKGEVISFDWFKIILVWGIILSSTEGYIVSLRLELHHSCYPSSTITLGQYCSKVHLRTVYLKTYFDFLGNGFLSKGIRVGAPKVEIYHPSLFEMIKHPSLQPIKLNPKSLTGSCKISITHSIKSPFLWIPRLSKNLPIIP